MREIKFRAWIKEKEIMTYFEDESYILNGDMSVDEFDYDKSSCQYFFEPCYKTVDAEIMQYTGLHDKNGTEIYEGDIVKITYRKGFKEGEPIYEEFIAKVNYYSKYTSFIIENCKPASIRHECENLGDYENIEVIGNIYDNPDLLKGE